jgi:hypothetical protein
MAEIRPLDVLPAEITMDRDELVDGWWTGCIHAENWVQQIRLNCRIYMVGTGPIRMVMG